MKDFSLIPPDERLSPPIIKGTRKLYEPSELITIGCEPKNMDADPFPKIQWIMDGREVILRGFAWMRSIFGPIHINDRNDYLC